MRRKLVVGEQRVNVLQSEDTFTSTHLFCTFLEQVQMYTCKVTRSNAMSTWIMALHCQTSMEKRGYQQEEYVPGFQAF